MATGLVALLCTGGAGAEAWWERSGEVWQEDDWIYAVGRSSGPRAAEVRAREALAGALRTALPDIDAELAAATAAVDERHRLDDRDAVRLAFPARYGEACNRVEAWLAEATKARGEERYNAALGGYAQAAWRQPKRAETIDGLATVLAEVGLWYAAAALLDDAAGRFREPPITMLRNRVTVHIWMQDRGGAERALDALREEDPADPEIQTMEAMIRATRAGRFEPTEKVVMLATAQTMDAELASRFAAWRWLPVDQRRDLVAAELAAGDVAGEIAVGPLRFEGLRGDWDAEHGLLEVEDRLDRTWRVAITGLDAHGSALAHAGGYEPPEPLVRANNPILLGGAFPLHPYPGSTEIDEVWVRPMYYSIEREIPDRLRLLLFVRTGDALAQIEIDGPIGLAREARPGMASAPQITEMLLLAARPAGADETQEEP